VARTRRFSVGAAAVGATVAAVSLGVASDAAACRPRAIPEHTVIEDPSDTTPPAAPEVGELAVSRAEDPGCTSGGSCDHGTVGFAVSSSDDRTATDLLGYSATVIEGEWPNDSVFMPTMRRAFDDGRVLYRWSNDDGSPFYVKLEVRAIDGAGNRSEPTVVEVSDGEFEGCGLSRARAGLWPVGVVLLGLGLAGVRRRRTANEV